MNAVPDPSPAADQQWLVHCSTERTLVARRAGGTTRLVKIFEQGSLVDAEQEAALARTLAQPGVVAYTGAGVDPVTNKPCVTMEFFAGTNLEQRIATKGPLAARHAARVVARLGQVLDDFHRTPRAAAPLGVVHRDIKPANVFLRRSEGSSDPFEVVLIDLEHVTPRTAPSDEAPTSIGFTGGTHGYAPAEAYLGSDPTPAFDVFGLGATLFFVLTGCHAFEPDEPAVVAARIRAVALRRPLLVGQPAALRELIERCLAVDPAARPDAAGVVTALEAFLAAGEPGDAALERTLQAVQAADFATAAAQLDAAATAAHDADRYRALTGLAARRARQWLRHTAPAAPSTPLDGDLAAAAGDLARDLPQIAALLHRFPLHEPALRAREALARRGQDILEAALPIVSALKAKASFAQARSLLDATRRAAAALARVPGGLGLSRPDSGHLPGPLLRHPARILERAEQDLARAEAVHADCTGRLRAAEADLDLAAAGTVADEITSIYSGASAVAAEARDRLHRLDFYIQRVAAPQRLLEQLGELLELSGRDHDLATVEAFARHCRSRLAGGSGHARAKGGVRALLDVLEQLLEDFPHAEPAVGPAAVALRAAMESITEQAWDHVAEVQQKLQAIPVPIRPVQKLLNRIDGIRMLEAFVDLPDRSRARLQDEIERLRMRLDQARTTRDNIARGAQEAMDKGHLTTALFDMERAVEGYEDEAEDDQAGAPLADRLEEAKRRKNALEHATVENHRLAARYVELLDDDNSELRQRLAVLEERADVLGQLVQTLGAERGAHYRTDLREVTMHLIQERAEHGERQLDHAASSAARLEIVDATLRSLRETVQRPSMATELTGRARRVIDHWQHKRGEVAEQLQQEARAVVDAHRRRRRAGLSLVGLLVVLAALPFVHELMGGEAAAGTVPAMPELAPTPPFLTRDGAGALHLPADAAKPLQAFADQLAAGGLKRVEGLADLDLTGTAVHLAAELAIDAPEATWQPSLLAHLQKLEDKLAILARRLGAHPEWSPVHDALVAFGRRAHVLGLSRVLLHADPAQKALRDWRDATVDLTLLALPADELARLAAISR